MSNDEFEVLAFNIPYFLPANKRFLPETHHRRCQYARVWENIADINNGLYQAGNGKTALLKR